MKYTKIYIGANNETKELELNKIKEILHLTGQLDGYTLYHAQCYWKGSTEFCAVIEIYGSYNISLIDILKRQLKQESIMVVKDYKVVEFI